MSERCTLEAQLNDFDPVKRRSALDQLLEMVRHGEIPLPDSQPQVNLHAHTFFSYNGYGYSPSYFAWKARLEGLFAAGIVDFDVLDGVDEFLEAARLLGLKGCAGLETRVFVPELADKEINSPGEPGISYYMGMGFPSKAAANQETLASYKAIAQRRNEGVIARVNPVLDPVSLDLEADVLPLTPAGNATERHLCAAYDAKARELFPGEDQLAAFWAQKLGVEEAKVREALPSGPAIQGLIRSKMMKAGGPGYVAPESKDFPRIEEVSTFAKSAGAIPTMTLLFGLSEGERDIGRLLNVCEEAGAAAVNLVPDRNWNVKDPKERERKVAAFHKMIAAAEERHLPIAVGTEMNAHGLRFVDDFTAEAMVPVSGVFLRGACLFYAHTVLQGQAGMGFLSEWAEERFPVKAEKNAFYERLGRVLEPAREAELAKAQSGMAPDEVMALAQG